MNAILAARGVRGTCAALFLAITLMAPIRTNALDLRPVCFVTAGGEVDGESFGGQAKGYQDGRVDGRWTHSTRDGRTLDGDVERLVCSRNGGNPEHPEVEFSIADLTGTGTFDGESVEFSVTVEDDGEPLNDAGREFYRIVIGTGDQIIHAVSGSLESGNIQIHRANYLRR